MIVTNPFAADFHHPGGELTHEPAVVGHQDQGALVVLQARDQCLDGLQVQVVGRLVQHQDVGLLQRQAAEHKPRRLATGQGAKALFAVVAGKQHQSHVPPDEAPVLARTKVPEPLLGRAVGLLQLFVVVLREVARMALVSPLDLAMVRFKLAHHDLEQRGLTDPVGPHDDQAVASADLKVYPMQHLLVPKRLFQPGDPEYIPPALAALHEAELGIAARAAGELFQLVGLFFDHPQLALGLPCLACLGLEAVDERLVVGDLLLPALDLLFPSLPVLYLLLDERSVVPLVKRDGLVIHVQDTGGDVVQKAVVVGDDRHRPREIVEKLFQPADGNDVQVVGGLEEQDVRRARQHLCKEHPELEATGKGGEADGAPRSGGQAPPGWWRREPRRCSRRAAAPSSSSRTGRRRSARGPWREARVLFDHRLPKLRVAHQSDAENLLVLVQELILDAPRGGHSSEWKRSRRWLPGRHSKC